MANLKLSSKMHIMVIVSALVIAIGLAVGLVCQFLAGGFFNYGAEYSSYNMVAVDYAFVDLSSFGDEDGIKDVCDEEFEKVGVSYYAFTSGDTNGGGELVFKFNKNTDEANVKKAAEAIQYPPQYRARGLHPQQTEQRVFPQRGNRFGRKQGVRLRLDCGCVGNGFAVHLLCDKI